MFEELIKIFSGNHPLTVAGEQFEKMLELVRGMIEKASGAYWGHHLTQAEQRGIYDTDVEVNRLQRAVRKQVILHLSAPERTTDVPYGLLLMSLVKDAERLGDYAKNLLEVHDLTQQGAGDLPNDELTARLRKIASFVEKLSRESSTVYSSADKTRAQELATEGRQVSAACEALIKDVARSGLDASIAVDMSLAARFYKRIAGHLLNLLSSVLMPLHKLDYLDEDELPPSVR